MIYKLITHYYLYNNAFAYLSKDDKGELTAIFPIKAANMEFLSDPQDNLYCKFLFDNGNSYILPYSDIIHLRRNFNDNELFGDPNTAVNPALQLAHTQNEASVAALKNGAYIRGILKIPTMLNDKDRRKLKDRFITDYMNIDNNGGVLTTDMSAEYEPIDNKPYIIDSAQHQAVKNKIYAYLGISEKIVMSLYNRIEFSAFYESVIEPFAIQLSLEFTEKIFTHREQSFGNSILFEYDFFKYASTSTKISLIKDIVPLGLISVNQALDILDMPSVPDGDKRVVSLNYVNAAKADKYQLGSEEE